MDAPFAVTLDFHDTLFRCDDWFTLEVEQLVPAFLRWRAPGEGGPSSSLLDYGRASYRRLRGEIIASGLEQSAIECVLRVCREIGVAAERAEVETGVDALMHATLTSTTPLPGAVALVAELRAAGARLAVISNAVHHPFLEWALAAHGLASSFDAVVSSASAGFYKSRPEIYRETLRVLEVPPARAVHVGDSYRFDVLGAAAAGLRTVWLTPAQAPADNGHADLIVNTLEGLAPKIRALLAGSG
ncbi:MAG TPA: HAD family hydrolase [Thermomicrobiaceae bacterium]|nr:HAD family hydrolase [Thermomicrobiaceae bacterium]